MNRKRFNQYFPKAFAQGTIEAFFNKGNWAIHDVLPFLFSELGTFDLKIATFNISEDSMRPVFFMRERNEIRSLRLLLDYNIKRHKLDMLLFAAHITPQIRLDANHAKILLASNDTHSFGIVGSQNLNQPRRNEAGFYFTAGKHFTFFSNCFDLAFEKGTKYEIDG